MRARRGYHAANAADRGSDRVRRRPLTTVPVTEALGTLSRFRPDAQVFVAASATAAEVHHGRRIERGVSVARRRGPRARPSWWT